MLACSGGCGPALEELAEAFLRSQVSDRSLTGVDPGEPVYEARAFVNWESPTVAPLALTPDRARLLAVNTADNRLELLDVTGPVPRLVMRVPVGLDPVSVRARGDHEAWVVNHVSDSVSVVDLSAGVTVATLHPGDEPTDVAFAAGRAFVVCSQENRVAVYDLANLAAAPQYLSIAGEEPRAIAVAPSGAELYVTIFESGNATTGIPEEDVQSPESPYAGENPIPIWNDEALAAALANLPAPPPTAVIVRRAPETGQWRDENGADWSHLVPHEVLDHDIAVIDAATLDVRYVSGLMNLNMAIGLRSDGSVTVVGTDATNELRFEPRLTGKFVRSRLARYVPESAASQVSDLNPHLREAYAAGSPRVGPELRRKSVADPRAIAWTAADVGFVAGMGSNNVVVIDAAGERLTDIPVGAGPAGLALDEPGARLYVLNRFDASISAIDLQSRTVVATTALPDPTPAAIKAGRPLLYDAVRTSGLGVTACAACHVDARMDQLAWDLGDPAGALKTMNQPCLDVLALSDTAFGGAQPDCEDFHPLKGPMVTQTLQGVLGTEPLHWRGDRANLEEFNPAFVSLNGADAPLSAEELAQFREFLGAIAFPPNPNRNMDNSLRGDVAGGDAVRGREIFMTQRIDEGNRHALGVPSFVLDALTEIGPVRTCVSCHALPTGSNGMVVPRDTLSSRQSIKVPQLRNMHEKAGTPAFAPSTRGFGFTHDGDRRTLEEFLGISVFDFGADGAEQRRRDVIAFVMSFSTDTHAAVGQQATLAGPLSQAPQGLSPASDPDGPLRAAQFLALADSGAVGLVARGRFEGELRGFAYGGGGLFQSDRRPQTVSAARLALPLENEVVTWTVVPLGSEVRIGIDADLDGTLDGDMVR